MRKIVFLLLILKFNTLQASYPFDNFAYLYIPSTDPSSSGPAKSYLSIPVVEFRDHLYTDIKLQLEENGQYSLQSYNEPSDDTENWIRKIHNSNCVINDNFGRFIAQIAFLKKDRKYCLVRTRTGTCPGVDVSYLFIENGSATLVQDLKYGFNPIPTDSGRFVVSNTVSSITIGIMEDTIFVEQSDLNHMDFDSPLLLKLYDNLGNLIEYF